MAIELQGMDNNMVETLKRKLEEERQREEEEEEQQKAKKAQDRENEEPVKKKIMVEQVHMRRISDDCYCDLLMLFCRNAMSATSNATVKPK